jgi:hypothetical protein
MGIGLSLPNDTKAARSICLMSPYFSVDNLGLMPYMLEQIDELFEDNGYEDMASVKLSLRD